MTGAVERATPAEVNEKHRLDAAFPDEAVLRIGCGACKNALCVTGSDYTSQARVHILAVEASNQDLPLKYRDNDGSTKVTGWTDTDTKVWIPEEADYSCGVDDCPNADAIRAIEERAEARKFFEEDRY
jgi:hypothetical protein